MMFFSFTLRVPWENRQRRHCTLISNVSAQSRLSLCGTGASGFGRLCPLQRGCVRCTSLYSLPRKHRRAAAGLNHDRRPRSENVSWKYDSRPRSTTLCGWLWRQGAFVHVLQTCFVPQKHSIPKLNAFTPFPRDVSSRSSTEWWVWMFCFLRNVHVCYRPQQSSVSPQIKFQMFIIQNKITQILNVNEASLSIPRPVSLRYIPQKDNLWKWRIGYCIWRCRPPFILMKVAHWALIRWKVCAGFLKFPPCWFHRAQESFSIQDCYWLR